MRDAGHRTPDARRRTPDGRKSKNNIYTPQGGGHNSTGLLSLGSEKCDDNSDNEDTKIVFILLRKSKNHLLPKKNWDG